MTWLSAVALAGLVLPASVAWAKTEVGPFGLSHKGLITGVFGSSTRTWGTAKGQEWSGKQIYASAEGGMFGKVSPLGNYGGIEGMMAMGYDGATPDMENNNSKGPILGGFLYDFAVGFPVTLFHQFSDGKDRFQFQLAPGFGFNHLHAYLYLKTKVAYQVTSEIAGELQWQWWPGPTSVLMNDDSGLNQSSVKGTVFIGRYGDTCIAVFGEYLWSELETEQPGKALPGSSFGGKNPFTSTTRQDYESTIRLGAGVAF